MAIYSCMGCTERHPYCHSHCEKYITEKAAHDARKAADDKKKYVSFGVKAQRDSQVEKAQRDRRNAYRYRRK